MIKEIARNKSMQKMATTGTQITLTCMILCDRGMTWPCAFTITFKTHQIGNRAMTIYFPAYTFAQYFLILSENMTKTEVQKLQCVNVFRKDMGLFSQRFEHTA